MVAKPRAQACLWTVLQTTEGQRGSRVVLSWTLDALVVCWGQRERHQYRRRQHRNDTREVGWAPMEQHPKPQARFEPQQSNSVRAEVVGVDGHRIVIGGRLALIGMRNKNELEGKTGEVKSIMEEQGKI